MHDTKTAENLMAAFAGESQANRKYLAYAKKAEAEGKDNIAKLFRATADAETIHAFKEFELAGMVNSTEENLRDAVDGETYEYKEMYPEFMEVAQSEGNKAAVTTFSYALQAEEVHAKLFQEALDSPEESGSSSIICAPSAATSKKRYPNAVSSAECRVQSSSSTRASAVASTKKGASAPFLLILAIFRYLTEMFKISKPAFLIASSS